MKYLKLFESYKSQKEIESLSETVIKIICSETMEHHSDDSKIRSLDDMKLNMVNSKHFNELVPFIRDFGDMLIAIISPDQIEGYNFVDKGCYISGDNSGNKFLFIQLDSYFIKQVNEPYSTLYDNHLEYVTSRALHFYKNTMTHELQHAYDDWRSNGKFSKTSKEYDDNISKNYELNAKGLSNLKKDELEFISKHYKEYHSLKHEVDARFTSAIQQIAFYDWDFDASEEQNKDVFVMNPFDEVKANFKRKMGNWKFTTDKEQWRVLRKFGQFYEIEREFVDKLNKEQKEWK